MNKGCQWYIIKQVAIVTLVMIVSNIIRYGEFVNPLVNEPSNPLLYILLVLPLLAISFVYTITRFFCDFLVDVSLGLFKFEIGNEKIRNIIVEIANIVLWVLLFTCNFSPGNSEMTYDDYMFYYRIP